MKKKVKPGLDLEEGIGIRTAVDVVIFNQAGQVLLGKRKAAAGENSWGFPGGHQKTNELISETARREIREELGSSFDIELTNEVLAVRENKIYPWFVHHLTIMIRAIFKGGKPQLMEQDRCLEWKWFNLDDLPEKMFSAEKEILENYKLKMVKVVTDWQEEQS